MTTLALSSALSHRRAGKNTAMRRSLNGHLADETYSVELVKRAMTENRGTPLGTFLEMLSWDLEDDRDTLVRVMRRLGVRQTRREVIRAWIAEKIGRLRLSNYSPRSALVELESLQAGIGRKIDLWSTLRSSGESRIDFDELMHRAELQADALERRRVDVAADA